MDADRLRGLLENESWVKRLARRLLYDESFADDVVQDVWITAIQKPPSKPGAMRAWLAKVVRTMASRQNDALVRRRRLDPEPPLPSPATDEVVETLETQQRISDAVLALPDPYRKVVYYHFYHGLRLVEIARLTGSSSSTVRTQLSRGLERLRERLEREYGGATRLRSVLLPLVVAPGFGVPLGGAASSSEAVGSARESSSPPGDRPRASASLAREALTVALGVTIASLVVTSAWFATTELSIGPDGAAASVEPDDGGFAPKMPSRVVDSSSVTPALGDAVQHLERPGAERPGTERIRPAVRLRIVDALSGSSVAEARVFRVHRTDAKSHEIGTTDRAGELEVPYEVFRRDSLMVLAAGYTEHRDTATPRISGGFSEDPYVLSIEPSFDARVRLVLPDGRVASGVPVRIRSRARGLDIAGSLDLRSDARGEVVYDVRFFDTWIEIDVDGYAVVSRPLETPLDVVELAPAAVRWGVVSDAAGRPVGGASVRIASSRRIEPTRVETDARGRFRIGGVASGEALSATVAAAGFPRLRVRRSDRDREEDWRIVLSGGVLVTGRVRAPDGTVPAGALVFVLRPESPVGGSVREDGAREDGAREDGSEAEASFVSSVRAAGVSSAARGRRRLLPLHRTRVRDDGSFELGPVGASSDELYFFVQHRRYENALRRLTLDGAPIAIELREGRRLEGIARSPSGSPVPGCVLHVGERWSNGVEAVVGRAKAGADGRFELLGLPELGEALRGGGAASNDERIVRQAVFLSAFAPDSVAAVDGIGPDPALHGAVSLERSLESSPPAEIEVVAAKRDETIDVAIRLFDQQGWPVRTSTSAIVLAPSGGVSSGLLGRNLAGSRFFADASLAVETLRADRDAPAWMLVRPERYRWAARRLDLDVDTTNGADVTLEGLPAAPPRFRCFGPGGAFADGRPIYIGFPFEAPAIGVALGRTGSGGALSAGSLSPGRYTVFAAPPEASSNDVGVDWIPLDAATSSAEVTIHAGGGTYDLTFD